MNPAVRDIESGPEPVRKKRAGGFSLLTSARDFMGLECH